VKPDPTSKTPSSTMSPTTGHHDQGT
jgi:hypothetical protein